MVLGLTLSSRPLFTEIMLVSNPIVLGLATQELVLLTRPQLKEQLTFWATLYTFPFTSLPFRLHLMAWKL